MLEPLVSFQQLAAFKLNSFGITRNFSLRDLVGIQKYNWYIYSEQLSIPVVVISPSLSFNFGIVGSE